MVFKVEHPVEHILHLRLDTNVRIQEEDIGTTQEHTSASIRRLTWKCHVEQIRTKLKVCYNPIVIVVETLSLVQSSSHAWHIWLSTTGICRKNDTIIRHLQFKTRRDDGQDIRWQRWRPKTWPQTGTWPNPIVIQLLF